LRRDDGTGGQSVANVNEALTYLDDALNPFYIFFKWDNIINYIDDTTLFDTPSGVINNMTYDHSDGIDMYLGDDTVGHPLDGYGYGQTAGVGVSSKLLVTGSYFGNIQYPLVRSFVLAHEMGHVFNLWHTRHGNIIEDLEDDPNQCPELVNGSNGWDCGDYIIDTPADPDIAFNINPDDCEWLGSGVDANGDPYDPDELNMMARTHPVCMEYFSFQQSRRIKTALALISFLQDVSTYTSYQGNPCAPSTLNFYPNAADGELNLDLTNKPANTYTYYIYDSNGIVVLSGVSPNVLETIDTSGLVEGLYFLHFHENGGVVIKQIVVDH
jgi:Secretion system C-terminal sorting domain